jgi:hypothetical protein
MMLFRRLFWAIATVVSLWVPTLLADLLNSEEAHRLTYLVLFKR